MAASPASAVASSKADGGNALAALLAAAAASMHRQQQQSHANVNMEVHNQGVAATNNLNKKFGNDTTPGKSTRKCNEDQTSTIQRDLEAKRDTLCQLLNLKPASLIDSSSVSRSPVNAPPPSTHLDKRLTNDLTASSVQKILSSRSRDNKTHNIHEFHDRILDKHERTLNMKQENGHHSSRKNDGNNFVRSGTNSIQTSNNNKGSISNNQSKRQSTNSNNISNASINVKHMNGSPSNTETSAKPRNKTNHKISTSSSAPIDKDSASATKLLASLINGSSKKVILDDIDPSDLRDLETWNDEDVKRTVNGDVCYEELVDSSNSNGWSADEMFKYNEKMHNITSSYDEKTLSSNYTTPLPNMRSFSKTFVRMAGKIAKTIEDRVIAEGRITPESSDDDELFEAERLRRVQLKNQKQLNQLKNVQRQSQPRANHATVTNNIETTKSSSQYSNSTATPATVSLSSSPTLTDNIKSVTSSSRNILRTCLT